MKRQIKAYIQQIEGLVVITIENWDAICGRPVSWLITGVYHGTPFTGLFVVGYQYEFPSLELVEQRIQESLPC